MYMMNQHDHEKVMELLLNEDPREAIDFLQAKADEQEKLRAEHDGTITCAHAAYVDDDCEIDDLPVLSVADKGVWVSAWVWVSIEDDDDEGPDVPYTDSVSELLDPEDVRNIKALANAFSKRLREQLTEEQLFEVILRNVNEKDPSVCHTHDYLDANMVMAYAWEDVMIGEAIIESEGDIQLWNAAWNLAKENGFKEVKDAEA